MLLSDKYPFLANYFQTGIKNNRLSHSLLFYGNDLEAQYQMALDIAKLLNCTGDKTDNCECLNCRWIKEGKHPAVLTITKSDNKPEGDTSETVISVKQSEMVRNSLIVSSDFHRVFIFCDKDDDGNIKGLNKLNFPEPTANSLLKSIEEPSEGVTFIFLTRDKEDLISTIISRSQCFFMPAQNKTDYNFENVISVIENYWDINRSEAFDLSEKLLELSKETPATDILEQIQNYILTILKSNPNRQFLLDDIKSVEQAKKEAEIGIRPDAVFDNLCLKIIK